MLPSHLNLPDHPDLEFFFETLTKWCPAMSWLRGPSYSKGRSPAKPAFGTIRDFDMFNWRSRASLVSPLKALEMRLTKGAMKARTGMESEFLPDSISESVRQADRMLGGVSQNRYQTEC